MGVRNCADIGDNLRKIVKVLMNNKTLVKLLYCTGKDPLSLPDNFYLSILRNEIALKDYLERTGKTKQELTEQEKHYQTYNEFCQFEIYEKLIKITPRVGPKETANSLVTVQVAKGKRDIMNGEFKNLEFVLEIINPLTQWIIKSDNLRPFLVLGEIQKSLEGLTINGLGKLDGGDFSANFLTEEVSCYEVTYSLTSYD